MRNSQSPSRQSGGRSHTTLQEAVSWDSQLWEQLEGESPTVPIPGRWPEGADHTESHSTNAGEPQVSTTGSSM